MTVYAEQKLYEDTCEYRLAFGEEHLPAFLDYLDVESVEDLSDEILRDLCRPSLRLIEVWLAGQRAQGARSTVSIETKDGHACLTSDEVGHDMTHAMLTMTDDEVLTYCDPLYSSVRLMLHVIGVDVEPPAPGRLIDSVGTCILDRLLKPPSLA